MHRVISEKNINVNLSGFGQSPMITLAAVLWYVQSLIQASPWALGRNVINILVSVNLLALLLGYVVEYEQTR